MNPLSTVLVLALGALAHALPQGGDGGAPPFGLFDANGDGFIDTSELNKLAAMMPSTPGAPDNQFMEVVIPMMDTDNDGKLNQAEFNQLMSGGPPPGVDESGNASPQMTLALMDADKNGKVNADEILAFFSKMGGASPVADKNQAEAMIAAVDSDGDGELNEAEMAKMSAAGGAPPAASGDGAKSNDDPAGSGVDSLTSTRLSLLSAVLVMAAAKWA